VLFFGLAGLVFSSLCFGVSKSFAGVVISRALAGALNVSVLVQKKLRLHYSHGLSLQGQRWSHKERDWRSDRRDKRSASLCVHSHGLVNRFYACVSNIPLFTFGRHLNYLSLGQQWEVYFSIPLKRCLGYSAGLQR
jgi:hypothetical protein